MRDLISFEDIWYLEEGSVNNEAIARWFSPLCRRWRVQGSA